MENFCDICLEKNIEKPLKCGHYVHLECAKKHFKPECPVCKTVLEIEVTGVKPELYLPYNPSTVPDDDEDFTYENYLNEYYRINFGVNIFSSSY